MFQLLVNLSAEFDKPQAVLSEEPQTSDDDSKMAGTIQSSTPNSSSMENPLSGD